MKKTWILISRAVSGHQELGAPPGEKTSYSFKNSSKITKKLLLEINSDKMLIYVDTRILILRFKFR